MNLLHSWARALGGEVSGDQVLCPGPGHSAKDRSLSVKIGEDGEPIVYSHADDDWKFCRDYVRQRIGMGPFKPNGGRKTVASYDFCDPATGAVRYRKERVEAAGGAKSFFITPKGRGGSDPLLYGGERLADLAEGQHVFVVEGEKMVNRLRELGAAAVSGDSGFESKWLPAHAGLLRGLSVVLWPDSDEPGEKYAANAAKCLKGSAASLRVVRPFGKPNGAKGRDVCDWTGNADDLAELVAGAEPYEAIEQKPEPPAPLQIINIASFAGRPVPERDWFVPDVIIANRVTILSGNGGDGKSLLAAQLAIATVTATGWIGYLPKPGGALYASAEDDPGELHRRIADIIEGRDDLSFEAMDGFDIINLAERDALFVKPEGRAGTLTETVLFTQIKAAIAELRPILFVTDALANVYGGDENVRTQAAQFIALLDRLAMANSVTVILIAHPSLSGISSGSGMSGNTHWNNGARGRLYLEPAMDNDGEPDPCLRKLTIKKNNYGPKGTSVALKWDRGRFLLMGGEGSFERMAAEAKDDSLFLKLLKVATEQGRTVSPNPSNAFAPTVFAGMPDAGGVKAPKLKAAMERLLRDKKIAVVEIGPPSARKAILVET
ncbi:MAG: hypothetical protein CR217_06065 [Beijerinckiaceae bacterium]|nr:MAG: hypothetical protein CR217_06065 [Beijerinckiaceae bacterium]